MNRLLVLTLALSLSFAAAAQNWCPPGATWTHTYTDGWIFNGYARFEYAGDTLIDGESCQRIDQYSEAWNFIFDTLMVSHEPAALITKVEGDLVSILTETGFDTLYWFGASPGDHWYVAMPYAMESLMRFDITDTGTVVIGGLPLRYVAAGADTMVERLGSLSNFMLPWNAALIDHGTGPLRCYSDATISFHAPWWPFGCASGMGIDNIADGPRIPLSPNPGRDQLVIQLPPGTQAIQVHDALGRMVFHTGAAGSRIEVDTGAWPQGLYMVQVDGRPAQRWVKE